MIMDIINFLHFYHLQPIKWLLNTHITKHSRNWVLLDVTFNIYLTEACVMHDTVYSLLLPEYLVLLFIWIIISYPFFIIWQVFLANARWLLTSRGTYIFMWHPYILKTSEAISRRCLLVALLQWTLCWCHVCQYIVIRSQLIFNTFII